MPEIIITNFLLDHFMTIRKQHHFRIKMLIRPFRLTFYNIISWTMISIPYISYEHANMI